VEAVREEEVKLRGIGFEIMLLTVEKLWCNTVQCAVNGPITRDL